MVHEKPIYILCYLKNQSIDIRKGALITTDFSYHERAHATEAREIQTSRLVKDEICDPARKAASEVAPHRMSLVIVVGIDHLLAAPLAKSQKALHLLRRILQVVVHRNYVSSA